MENLKLLKKLYLSTKKETKAQMPSYCGDRGSCVIFHEISGGTANTEHGTPWIEKSFKISLSSTHGIDDETKAGQRIQENPKTWRRVADAAKERTAKNRIKLALECPPRNAAESLPAFSLCFCAELKITPLSKHTTLGQRRERDTAQERAGRSDPTGLLSKAGFCTFKTQTIHARETESNCGLYFDKTHGKMRAC